MKMPTLKPLIPPSSAPISADSVAARIGGTGDQLAERFGVVAVDFMGRPMIAAEHARQAWDEAMRKQAADSYLPSRYDVYLETRKRRLEELRSAARAEAS